MPSFDHEFLVDLFRNHGKLAVALLRTGSLLTRRTGWRILANLSLLLRDDFPGIEKVVPQYHLASYRGITPVALSRIRGRMKAAERSVIKRGGSA